ncbi:MAG: histidine phosphatase family protein [Gemmatimonadota bacterium]
MILAPAVLALALAVIGSDSLLSADAMLVELRKGGYTILWRHTATDQSNRDAPGYPNTERYQQRNLSDQGVTDAKTVGLVFKNAGVPIGEVLASPMFRTRETAQYAFGRVTVAPELIALMPTPEQRRLLTTQPPAGTNRVLVTHHFVLERNAPGIKPGDLTEGEAVVVRAVGDQLETIGVFKMADWRRLVGQAGGAGASTGAAGHGAYQESATPAPITHVPLVMPPLLASKPNAVVAEYLEAFNTGEASVMRRFFERSTIPSPDRTLDQRLEIYSRLLRELGTLAIVSAEATATDQITIVTQGSLGKPATFTIRLESSSPNRIVSISVQVGGP